MRERKRIIAWIRLQTKWRTQHKTNQIAHDALCKVATQIVLDVFKIFHHDLDAKVNTQATVRVYNAERDVGGSRVHKIERLAQQHSDIYALQNPHSPLGQSQDTRQRPIQEQLAAHGGRENGVVDLGACHAVTIVQTNALARERPDGISAHCILMTIVGPTSTFINVDTVAVGTYTTTLRGVGIPSIAHTRESVDAINARTSTRAWRRCAVIHVVLARCSVEASNAAAQVPILQVGAGAAIDAWRRGTFINVLLTCGSFPSRGASACELVVTIHACCPVLARI